MPGMFDVTFLSGISGLSFDSLFFFFLIDLSLLLLFIYSHVFVHIPFCPLCLIIVLKGEEKEYGCDDDKVEEHEKKKP